MNNEFNIGMSVEEFEETLRDYYCSLDSTITDVIAKCSCSISQISGACSDAWQRNVGGYDQINVDLTIIHEIFAFGKKRVAPETLHLQEADLTKILSDLTKKEGLKVTQIYHSYSGEPITIVCKIMHLK